MWKEVMNCILWRKLKSFAVEKLKEGLGDCFFLKLLLISCLFRVQCLGSLWLDKVVRLLSNFLGKYVLFFFFYTQVLSFLFVYLLDNYYEKRFWFISKTLIAVVNTDRQSNYYCKSNNYLKTGVSLLLIIAFNQA